MSTPLGRAVLSILVAAAAWWHASYLTYLPLVGTPRLEEPSVVYGVLALGVDPWLYGLLIVQLAALLPWRESSWAYSSRTRDVAMHLAAGAGLVSAICLLLPLVRALFHVDLRELAAPVRLGRIAGFCAVGCVGAGLLAAALRMLGRLPGLTLVALAPIGVSLALERSQWSASFGQLIELKSLSLLAVLLSFGLALWLWRDAYTGTVSHRASGRRTRERDDGRRFSGRPKSASRSPARRSSR